MKHEHYKQMVLNRVKLAFPNAELQGGEFGSSSCIIVWHDGERYGRGFDDEHLSNKSGRTVQEARQEAFNLCMFVVREAICKIDKQQAQIEIKRAHKQ